MSLRLRLALGAMALWGTVYALVVLAADSGTDASTGAQAGSAFGPLINALSAANALAVFLAFAAIATRSKTLRAIQGVSWVFAMMFFYPLALPAFWFLHVWRAPARPGTSGGTPGAG